MKPLLFFVTILLSAQVFASCEWAWVWDPAQNQYVQEQVCDSVTDIPGIDIRPIDIPPIDIIDIKPIDIPSLGCEQKYVCREGARDCSWEEVCN